YVHGYDVQRSDNKLLVNVFDYDDGWTVKAVEGGTQLPVKRIDGYDPLHIIHFNTKGMNTNSTAMTFPTLMTSHLFEVSARTATSPVTVTVTDSFGRQYVETVIRPLKLYDMSISSNY
ncbi:MAG: calcineurin-like phosphoesterase C-terminal domain-containing protein, partial [Bacteroidales bacterium]|nr:calcineurin-like phosphoesterase C-terminal domain-containing protein [Bacteroidales bacterium]